MHFVLFRGNLAASPAAADTSDRYYSIARNMPGFLTESSWRDPSRPNLQFLFATFADEDAVKTWRNDKLRLGMMHSARHEVFTDFRTTIGVDVPETEPVVLVHKRPALLEEEDVGVNVRSDEARLGKLTTGSELYTREGEVMWVWPLAKGVDVDDIVRSLERVEGDVLFRVHVLREYTKDDRGQAPQGLDKAEEEAVAA